MNPLLLRSWQFIQFLNFLFKAKSRYRIHSPFVYQFIEEVHCTSFFPEELQKIEQLRKQLARDRNTFLHLIDFGAGYQDDRKRHRTVTMAEVIRSSARKPRSGRFLYHLTRFLAPKRVLELGTNLGFSSLYLAFALPSDATIITIEGDPILSSLAQKHISHFHMQEKIKVVHSSFVQFFSHLQEDEPPYDLVFIDGHHDGNALLHYVSRLKPFLRPSAGILLDDIRWSPSMLQAFQELCSDPDFTLTLDMFSMGLLFFRKSMAKQHFLLYPPLIDRFL